MKSNRYTFRNAPAPTPPEKKRHQFESAVIADESFWRKIAKLKSPVENEPEPKFMINFHCRERQGKPFMSYTMAASAADLAVALAYWILDAADKLHYEPAGFAERLAVGVKKAVSVIEETTKQSPKPEDN